jgi:prepilin-type N-terminal cleavage/methylation domain-containing protein
MRRAFTMLEMLMAVFILGVITTLSVLTFNAMARSWEVSTDYLDKMQRTDFAISQVVSGLRSMYYPHDGKQDERYGFSLFNNGDGQDERSSDIIEWSKTGKAIVGNKSDVADTVHRVQVMVLEEGNRDWRHPIERTGLYARLCPDSALRPEDGETDYSFANQEMYEPTLIVDGVCGFNCRVLAKAPDSGGSEDGAKFEDDFAESNAAPYKVELSFRMTDPEGRAYRSGAAPVVRIVRIPVHEQSLDGKAPPSEQSGADAKGGGRRRRR